MARAIAIAAVLAVLAVAPTASGSVVCSTHLTWHATSYRAAAVAAGTTLRVGRSLGNGTLHTCSTTNAAPPGYAARIGADSLIRPVFAVPGVRASVAVALKSRTRTTLYVSRATPTAAERAVLARLRHG